MTAQRLPWRRGATGEFVAQPTPGALARVSRHEHPSHLRHLPQWTWSIDWPGRFYESGSAYDRQIAADQATTAWWVSVSEADARDEALRPARAFMARLVETGEYDLDALNVERMAYADLMAVMDEVTRRWRGNSTLPKTEYVEQFERLIGELSAEFYRRRVA